MIYRNLKGALATVGVASIGVVVIGAVYLKRNKIQIIIKADNWSYETPDLITESKDLPN